MNETVQIPRAKKRSRICENDKRHIAKFNRNNGQAYTDFSTVDVQSHQPRDGSHTPNTLVNKFYLVVPSDTVEVCKRFFLQTYSLSDGRVSRALKKYREGKAPGEDLRGRKPNPINKRPEVIAAIVFKSAFEHQKNVRLLQGSMSQGKQGMCERKLLESHAKLNLHFQTPRKDTCKTCDLCNIKKKYPNLTLREKMEMETSHELHLRKAEKSRECIKHDSSCTNARTHVISMDLQKALPSPKLTVSDTYYKQRNRNMNVALTNQHYVQSYNNSIETIEEKFLVSGHSCLSNDDDFG
ncbi:hypothetical protein PR048_012796 [Dryococelus australis]|uniref:Uncharacterized protein n=1 Tax=Dryococelus australis TaxID=614101 RepID=A0ABQ9HR58_9NEOP|nr:hypothetical protein PR048_012796 [Dryococelus australis]